MQYSPHLRKSSKLEIYTRIKVCTPRDRQHTLVLRNSETSGFKTDSVHKIKPSFVHQLANRPLTTCTWCNSWWYCHALGDILIIYLQALWLIPCVWPQCACTRSHSTSGCRSEYEISCLVYSPLIWHHAIIVNRYESCEFEDGATTKLKTVPLPFT